MTETSKGYENDIEGILSKEFLHLISDAVIENGFESITVLLHYFMLETGYIPKNFDEPTKYKCMPENWKASGVYKIQYYHKNIPNVFCWMTCIPLYSTLAVHAALDNSHCHADLNIKLQVDKYLKGRDFSGKSRFIHVADLSRHFKDGFCFPLLALIYESAGIFYEVGLGALLDELKMYVLKFLPVKGIVSMSAVNKNFNSLCNSPFLWKYLFHRDFGKDGIPDIATSSSDETDWKKAYKTEYLKKKRKCEFPPQMHTPYRLRDIFPVPPDYEDDVGIIFHPGLEDVFPHLQRLQSPNSFFPYGPFRRYF